MQLISWSTEYMRTLTKTTDIDAWLFIFGLAAEYPATRTNFFVAGYAVRRNLLIQVEVYNYYA